MNNGKYGDYSPFTKKMYTVEIIFSIFCRNTYEFCGTCTKTLHYEWCGNETQTKAYTQHAHTRQDTLSVQHMSSVGLQPQSHLIIYHIQTLNVAAQKTTENDGGINRAATKWLPLKQPKTTFENNEPKPVHLFQLVVICQKNMRKAAGSLFVYMYTLKQMN